MNSHFSNTYAIINVLYLIRKNKTGKLSWTISLNDGYIKFSVIPMALYSYLSIFKKQKMWYFGIIFDISWTSIVVWKMGKIEGREFWVFLTLITLRSFMELKAAIIRNGGLCLANFEMNRISALYGRYFAKLKESHILCETTAAILYNGAIWRNG